MNIEPVFMFCFGLLSSIYGLSAIIRKETTVHFGQGRGFPVTLTGIPAVIAGVVTLLGGIVMVVAPIVLALGAHSVSFENPILFYAFAAGSITIILGLVVGSIYQAALNLGESLREKDKRKR